MRIDASDTQIRVVLEQSSQSVAFFGTSCLPWSVIIQ